MPIYDEGRERAYRIEVPKIVKKDNRIITIILDETTSLGEDVFERHILQLLYKRLGLIISKFIETKDAQLVVDIIKEYPWIIFDDGTQIMQSLFLALPSRKFSKILSHFKVGFWNPISDEISRWQLLTQKGISQSQQEEAKALLKKAGLSAFIKFIKPLRGRPVKDYPDREEFWIILEQFETFLKENYKEYIRQQNSRYGAYLYLDVEDNEILLSIVNRFIKENMKASFSITYIYRPPKKTTKKITLYNIIINMIAEKYNRTPNSVKKLLSKPINT